MKLKNSTLTPSSCSSCHIAQNWNNICSHALPDVPNFWLYHWNADSQHGLTSLSFSYLSGMPKKEAFQTITGLFNKPSAAASQEDAVTKLNLFIYDNVINNFNNLPSYAKKKQTKPNQKKNILETQKSLWWKQKRKNSVKSIFACYLSFFVLLQF